MLWADWKNLPSDSKKIHGPLAVEGVLVHFEYLTLMKEQPLGRRAGSFLG
jgi:hypothetical protein